MAVKQRCGAVPALGPTRIVNVSLHPGLRGEAVLVSGIRPVGKDFFTGFPERVGRSLLK